MFPSLTAFIRTFGLVVLTLLLIPVQAVLLIVSPSLSRKLPQWYHRQVLRICGIRLHIRGDVSTDNTVLFVSNHVSWIDISILSALAPTSFVAKAEIDKWPFVGMMARMQNTIFVQREKPTSAGSSASEVLINLKQGKNVVLFPEGTSTDGNNIVPFKSSLFAAVKPSKSRLEEKHKPKVKKPKIPRRKDKREPQPIAVQTVALAYARIGGLPIGRQRRHVIAWVGTRTFFAHAWSVLSQQPIDVLIEIGESVNLETFQDRKALCQYTEKKIKRDLAHLLCYEFAGPHPLASVENKTEQLTSADMASV